MRKCIIFLHSYEADSFTTCARSICADRDDVRFIDFDQLVRDLKPAQWPFVIDEAYPAEMKELFDGAFVVNRIFSLDPSIVRSDLLRHGHEELWLHVATLPLLNRAATLVHDIGTRGVSRSLLPLNTQWALMSDYGRNSIAVPRFAYGFGAEEPDLSELRDPMQKSIWSFFDWKTERRLPKSEEDWHRFLVEKPDGTPVICHYLGADNIWFSYPQGEAEFDIEVFEHLVDRANTCFKSGVGEFLAFVEADGTTRFYAFAPHMTAAGESFEFHERVERWLGDICRQDQAVA